VQNPGRIDTVHHWHGKIQNDQVRPQLFCFLNPLAPISGLPAYLEALGGIEQIAESFANPPGVIYHQNHFRHTHPTAFAGLGGRMKTVRRTVIPENQVVLLLE